jgi:hypothetical protein
MFGCEAGKSVSSEPDSPADTMMSGCHCGIAMKRLEAACCGLPEGSSSRESGKDPEAESK